VYSLAVKALNSPPTASSADRDVQRDRSPGALEQQVLEEVRGAVERRRLVARADADPDADAGRADAGHLLGDDPQPAGQDGAADAGPPTAVVPVEGVRVVRSCRASARQLPAERSPLHASIGAASDSASRRPAASSSSTTGISDSLPRSSISAISTWIFWPTETTSSTLSTRLPPARARSLLMCSRPSLPGQQRDERAEVGRLDDRAEVALADLGHRRVGDRVDRAGRPRPPRRWSHRCRSCRRPRWRCRRRCRPGSG
jgi:hypothetical protein